MKKTNKFLTLTLMLLFSLSFTMASEGPQQIPDNAQNLKIELTKAEKAFLEAHPLIWFGTDDRWEPYTIKKADGTLEGFNVDLLHYIKERTGANIQLVTGPWSQMVKQAKTRKIDGLATSTVSKERRPFFDFSKSYLSLFPIFVVAGNSTLQIDGINDLAGKSVAVLKGNQFYLNLLAQYPTVHVIESASELEAIKLTIENKADAAIVATTFLNKSYKQFLNDIKVGYLATDHPLDIVYSVRKDWPELVSIINKALELRSPIEKNKMLSMWFGFSPNELGLAKAQDRIQLTDQEKAFLKEHPKITLGAGISFAPFIMSDDDGKVIGYDAEIAKLIADRTGLKISFELGKWAEIQERGRKREVDGLSTANFTKERQKYYNASRSLIHLTPLVIVKKGNPKGIQSLKDIVGKRVVLQKDNALKNVLEAQTKDFEAIYVDSLHDIIKAIVSEKADFTIFEESAFYVATQIGLEKMIEAPFTIGKGMDFRFLLRNDWPLLQSIIDKGLQSISLHEKIKIRNKWLGTRLTDVENRIPLTDQEQTWIKQHPEIRLGVDPNWQPIEFLDTKGQHLGISSDYVQILNRRLGLNMKIVPNLSWPQVMDKIPQRTVDVLPAVSKIPAREKYLTYSKPYIYIDWVIISRIDTPKINNLAELEGRLTAVDEGYPSQYRLAQENPEIPLLISTTTLDALQSVIDGKAEAAVVELRVASLIINAHRIYSLKVDHNVFQNDDPIAFAVRNDWPELVQIINKGLASISQDQRKMIEQKWLAVPIIVGFTKMDMLRIILYVITVMGLFLVTFIIWNRRLKKEIYARAKLEGALKKSEERFRNLYNNAAVGLFRTRISDGKALHVNQYYANLTGYQSIQACLQNFVSSKSYANPKVREQILDKIIKNGEIKDFEAEIINKNGRHLWITFSACIYPKDGYIEGALIDITKRKDLEIKLRQAQKMESVGRLAGGVAHDYNNISSIIIGYSELALDKLEPSDPLYGDLMEILTAAKRSTDITQQLLAFARKQIITPKMLDLNDTIGDLLKMLQRLIGEDINLAWIPGAKLRPLKIDPSQINQIMANLCLNARDAIANVGRITVETKNVNFDQDYCDDYKGVIPGEYIQLSVSDDGCGMTPENRDKIFEPFFTTKDVGKGTGLGLSTVYGIVKQNHGFINVYSETKQGTTFRIYLPIHLGPTAKADSQDTLELPLSRGETVLLVEDEDSILKIVTRILEKLGYIVLFANSPVAAIKLAAEHADEINLLITDVVMPAMNGRELAESLQSLYPNLKTLFMSGYTADIIANRGVLEGGVSFIAKPFSNKELALKVREVLDQVKG